MDQPDSKQAPAVAHQFRTYASDLAKMGKGPADAKPVPAPAPKPAAAAPKPAASHPAAAPTPPAPIAQPEPAPTPAPAAPVRPYEPPPATIIPKAPTTEESREEVLARLRARSTPAPASAAPAEPPPATIIPSAPSTDEKREEVLARLRAKTGTPAAPAPVASIRPAPSAPPAPTPGPGAPSPIHTYKSDFSDKTKREKATPITVLAAEQNAGRGGAEAPKESSKNRMLLVAGSVLLILAGGASVFFAYTFVTGRSIVPFSPLVPSLIFGDRHEEIAGEGAELRGALVGLGSDLNEGEVAIAYVTTSSTTPKGDVIMVPAEGGALIEALGLPAPAIVLRNVENESTVGVIREGEARPFFILRVASYERTFAGMLSWEPTMDRDLGMFYPEYPEEEIVGTSTASSSLPVMRANPTFGDEVLDNHDVRALRDSEGRAILIYGYRDKETLVIARDEAAFSELLSRLNATRAQ